MDGEVEACSGGVFASCGVAITLLVNYLDGNVIKDSEGKAPYFDSLELFTVTSDNAEDFYKFLSDEHFPPTPSPTRNIRTCWFAIMPR